jgi:predicted 3-demethylubiquinone-9 3-methyltransferase (glyoxalase superfamily)
LGETSAGGDETAQQCGWLKDKYGRFMASYPHRFAQVVHDPNAEKSQQV